MTHSYLFRDQQRFNYALYGNKQYLNPHQFGFSIIENVNDGEELWKKLVLYNQNIKFVTCGHMTPDYVGNLISQNNNKEDVLQMLLDTQDFANGGDSWIQILEYQNNSNILKINTFSPYLKSWGSKIVEHYEFKYKQ